MPPAARVGDLTAHGTPLLPGPGSSNVLIEGMPAWRMGSDTHTCPLVTGAKPHGGGTVVSGSSTVLINDVPAARVGDVISEATAPNTIVSGASTVIIGGGRTEVSTGETAGTSTPTEGLTETPPDTPTRTATPAGTPTETPARDTGGEVELVTGEETRRCVAPIESDLSVEEYYGFDEAGDRSANTPDNLAVADATVTFLYRDTTTGERSLVIIHDDRSASGDGGQAILSFVGVAGSTWQVQDGSPRNDAYTTPNGTIGSSESALWSWPDERTDGGAIGPLGEDFGVVVSHRAEGSVRESSGQRRGLDRWLFLDGNDPDEPIEIANFAEREGEDVGISLITSGCG